METLVKDVVEQFKRTIAFLEKLKVDKKQKSDRDAILKDLKSCLQRCETRLPDDTGDVKNYDDVATSGGRTPAASSEDVYDDVVNGEDYDDVQTSRLPPPQQDEADGIYDDTGDNGLTYDDVSSTSASAQQILSVECENLTNPTIADFMELKKEAGLKNFLKSPWQKRWCIIHSGIFYMFENAKDKRQKEAFRIQGYQFKLREDITKEAKRKERCFEIKNNDKVYEFCASDKESLTKWSWALGGPKSASISDSLGGSAEESYDDVGIDHGPSKKKLPFIPLGKKGPSKTPSKSMQSSSATDGEEIYEETGDATYDDTANKTYDDTSNQTYNDTANRAHDGAGNETYDDTAGSLPPPINEPDDQLYEETAAAPSPRDHLPLPPLPVGADTQRRNNTKDSLPPLPGSPKPPGFPPALPTRDETGSASGTFRQNRPPMPVPAVGSNKRELPPPPGRDTPRPLSPAIPHFPPLPPEDDDFLKDKSLDGFGENQEDYINMYQGMWECVPDEDNELKFKRGEIIHIISTEYDDYGWWTAESRHQDIGLVPVGYLMKAYDI